MSIMCLRFLSLFNTIHFLLELKPSWFLILIFNNSGSSSSTDKLYIMSSSSKESVPRLVPYSYDTAGDSGASTQQSGQESSINAEQFTIYHHTPASGQSPSKEVSFEHEEFPEASVQQREVSPIAQVSSSSPSPSQQSPITAEVGRPVLRRSSRKGKEPVESEVPQVSTRRRSRLLDVGGVSSTSKRLRFDEEAPQVADRYTLGIYFPTEEILEKARLIATKGVHPEKPIHKEDFEKYGLYSFLASQSLLKTCSGFGGYSMNLVEEFYANYVPGAQEVTIRGTLVPFTPSHINMFLGLPDYAEESPNPTPADLLREITHGRVEEWHTTWKVTCVNVKYLTSKYAVLFRVGLADWFPSRHEGELDIEAATLLYKIVNMQHYNLGKWIFERIQAFFAVKRVYLIFPNFLSDYILSVSDVDLEKDEDLVAIEGEIRIHFRLLQEPHFCDLVEVSSSQQISEAQFEGFEGTELQPETSGDIQRTSVDQLSVEIPEETRVEQEEQGKVDATTGALVVTSEHEDIAVEERTETKVQGESSGTNVYNDMIANVDSRIENIFDVEETLQKQIDKLKEERTELFALRRRLIRLRDAEGSTGPL